MTSPPSAKWKPYPKYKDSGVEWLGEVPEHWPTIAAKRACAGGRGGGVIKGTVAGNPDGGTYPGFSASGQDVWLDEAMYEGPGIVLSAVGARCGKCFRADGLWGAVANTHVLLPRAAVDRDYLWRLVDDEGFWEKGGAAQPYIQIEDSLTRRIPLPPLSEQRAIADFLDRESGKIDALVARKERLIELLQEKRAALITHAVTKGLDPTVPMKDSGIEWLGEIPTHWEVRRLKFAARLESGHTPSRSVPEYWQDCTIPWVSLNDVGRMEDDDVVMETENLISELGLANSSARILPTGTVVLSRDATVGRAAILGRRMATSQHFVDWVCGEPLLPEYLLLVLRGPMQSEFLRLTNGATLRTIGMPDVHSLRTPIPPTEEQREIVAHVCKGRTHLDALIRKVQGGIELLREYRTALISAAVTGKIDVRHEVTGL